MKKYSELRHHYKIAVLLGIASTILGVAALFGKHTIHINHDPITGIKGLLISIGFTFIIFVAAYSYDKIKYKT
jgi:hypothetical protein